MKPGPKTKYKWKLWFGFKGHIEILHKGKHFDCQPHTMSIRLREEAKKRGIRISVHITGDKLVIVNKGRRLKRAKNKK